MPIIGVATLVTSGTVNVEALEPAPKAPAGTFKTAALIVAAASALIPTFAVVAVRTRTSAVVPRVVVT